MRFSQTPWAVRVPPPALGGATRQVLCELLGYTPQEAARLREAGVLFER